MTPEQITEARALVERLTGHTPGPWRERNEMIQHQSDWIDGNGTRHTDWKYPGVITEMPEAWDSPANGYLIAAAPDLHAHLTAALVEIERLRGLLDFAVEMTGEPDCWYDHHGYCQAHNLQPKGECWVELSRAALAGETDQ